MSNLLENCKNHLNSLEKRQNEINDLISKLGIALPQKPAGEQPVKNEENANTSMIYMKTQNVFKNFNDNYRNGNNSIALKKAFEKITDQKISQNAMKTLLIGMGGADRIYLSIKMKNYTVIVKELEKLLSADARNKFDEVLLQPQISDKLTITTSYIGNQFGDGLARKPKKLIASFNSVKKERSLSPSMKKPVAARSSSKFLKGPMKEILKEKTHRVFDEICKDAKSSKVSPKNQSPKFARQPPMPHLNNVSKLSASIRSRANDEPDISKTLNPKFNKNDLSKSFDSNQNKESLSRSLSPNQPIEFKVSPPTSQKRNFKSNVIKTGGKKSIHKTLNTSHNKKPSVSDIRPSMTNRSLNRSMRSYSKQPESKYAKSNFRGATQDIVKRTPNPKAKQLDTSLINKKNLRTFKDIMTEQISKNQVIKSKPFTRPSSQRHIKIKKPLLDGVDKKSESQSRSVNVKGINVDKKFMMTHNPSPHMENLKTFGRNDSQNNSMHNMTHSERPNDQSSMLVARKKALHQKTPSFNYKRPSSYNPMSNKSKNFEKKPSLKRIVKLSKETSPYSNNNQPKLQASQTSLTNLSKTLNVRKSNCLMNSSKSEIKEDDKNAKFIFETSLRNNSNQDKRIAKDLEIINYKPHKRHYPEFDQFYFNNKVLDF